MKWNIVVQEDEPPENSRAYSVLLVLDFGTNPWARHSFLAWVHPIQVSEGSASTPCSLLLVSSSVHLCFVVLTLVLVLYIKSTTSWCRHILTYKHKTVNTVKSSIHSTFALSMSAIPSKTQPTLTLSQHNKIITLQSSGQDSYHHCYGPLGHYPLTMMLMHLLINGYGFQSPPELVWSDGDAANCTLGDFKCGDWDYRAFRYEHAFHVQTGVRCSLAGPYGVTLATRVCKGKSGRRVEAKKLVLAPCPVWPCMWWVSWVAAIQEIEDWVSVAHGMDMLWA